MSKRKAYAKPGIIVEDFELNRFIAGACQISIKQSDWQTKLGASPLYKDMMDAGYFAAGAVNPCRLGVYSSGDDKGCYYNQTSPLIAS